MDSLSLEDPGQVKTAARASIEESDKHRWSRPRSLVQQAHIPQDRERSG